MRVSQKFPKRLRSPLSVLGLLLVSLVGLVYGSAPSRGARQEASREVRIRSNDDTYEVRYTLGPKTIEFGQSFDLLVEASRVDGAEFASTLAVDARMPEHRHGMNREPSVEVRPDGSLHVTGLYFHMPGYWEIYLDFTRGAITERAQFSVEVD